MTIAVQAAVLLVAVLVVFAGLVLVMVVRSEQHQVTGVLEQAVALTHGGGNVRRDGDDALTRSVSVAVADPHGFRVDGTVPTGLPDRSVMSEVARTGEVDQREVVAGGHHYEIRTDRHGDDTVQAMLDLTDERREFSRLVQAMVIGGSTGVLLTALAAAWLARRSVRPMAEALDLQQRFVSDAAHELRTPLTLISTRAQLLARRIRRSDGPIGVGSTTQSTTADLDGLVSDAANLTAILEELLTAADLREHSAVPVPLPALVGEAVDAARAHAAEQGVTVQLVPAATGGDPVVNGSRAALLRAVHALLDNAVGHARSAVEVELVPARPRPGRHGTPAEVALLVRDDGAGIDRERLPELFDRFAGDRAAGSGTRHYGLGLSLVSEIATRHGGSVTAGNRTDGPGAVFTLRLPVIRRAVGSG